MPGASLTKGSWRLTGNRLYFDVNKYSEYETVIEGDVISGKGWNRDGLKTQPFLRRVSIGKQQEKAQW